MKNGGITIRANFSHIENGFSQLGESKDLVKFLIFEGFLDDTYYQYISLFHSGRLSPNDNKFLIQIRSFNNPDPDFRLDNQAEVIAMMREEDFDQCYVLNRYLVDELLEHIDDYDTQLDKAVRYISGNFANCSKFFASYYTNGKQVGALVNAFVERWDGFASTAANAAAAVEHIANIVDYVPSKKLSGKLNVDDVISSFLAAKLSEVLEAKEEIDLEKLKLLEVEVEDISRLLSNRRAFAFVIENSLYQISTDNLRIALEHLLEADEVEGLDDKHFTTILSSGKEELCQHIERNFTKYLSDVLLQLEGNMHEEIGAIQRVLGHNEVSQEILEEFLVRQDAVFPSLDLIPKRFHPLIFEEKMVEPTWENIISFLDMDNFDEDVLTKLMQSPHEKNSLLQETYTNSEQTVPLSRFILKNEDFTNDEYRQYMQILPTRFQGFPDTASTSRRLILIEEDIIRLTEEVFEAAQGDDRVVESLLAHNIETFLEDKSKYPIDDTVRESLLASNISDIQKLAIIEDIDSVTVLAKASMAEKIGAVFEGVSIDFKTYTPDYIRSILVHSEPTKAKISLFNRCHEVLSFNEVRQVIEALPQPFPDLLLVGWSSPRIPNTSENRSLVAWLEERKIISSSSLTYNEREIRINTFRKSKTDE